MSAKLALEHDFIKKVAEDQIEMLSENNYAKLNL